MSQIQGGIQKQPKRRPIKNTFPFLRVANVLRGELDLSELHQVELFEGELGKYVLQKGDLLVVEGNGSISQLGRAAQWRGEVANCVHQNHLIRVRAIEGVILPNYLEHVWNSSLVASQLNALAASTSGLHTLSVAKLARVEVPLPPLEMQAHIADFLSDTLDRVQRARASVKAQLIRLSGAQEALISSEVADRYPETPMSQLLAANPANGKSVPTADEGFPVLRLTALQNGAIDLSERKVGAWTAAQAKPYLVEKGDILISRGNGSLRFVGRAGLVSEEPDPVAYPDTLVRITPTESRLDRRFLVAVWNSALVRQQIESAARTTAGIYKINHQIIQNVRIPTPSLEKQLELVARLDTQRELLDRLRASITKACARANRLRAALLTSEFESDEAGVSQESSREGQG